jgi:hypothetical protein
VVYGLLDLCLRLLHDLLTILVILIIYDQCVALARSSLLKRGSWLLVLVVEDRLIDLLLNKLRASELNLSNDKADHAPARQQGVLRGTRTHLGAPTIFQVLVFKQRGLLAWRRHKELLRLHTL